MIITRLILKNWRNFKSVDVALGDRVFLVGPNAAGKSNFLEVFRFLRDIAKSEGGGLQDAVRELGGLKKIRCLAARGKPDVEIAVHLGERGEPQPHWKYAIGLRQAADEKQPPHLVYEEIHRRDGWSKKRPDADDERDPERLTQTYLEQTFANAEFRDVAKFFEAVTYLHLVPQLVKHAEKITAPRFMGDPFGLQFMRRLSDTPKGRRTELLQKIEKALRVAVPHFKQLRYVEDKRGNPHVEVNYKHWRPLGARQQEDQFSDGTIRMLGLFWALLETNGVLLLEEPELSLNNAIVRQIPALMHEVSGGNGRQLIVSTHSYALLADPGVGLEEVLLLEPDTEGTRVTPASKKKLVRALVEGGMSVGEAALPLTDPRKVEQMSFW